MAEVQLRCRHRRRWPRSMRYFILGFLACAAFAACGNPLGLPAAYTTNTVDSLVSLYALSGTPVSLPSGYSVINALQHVVRTDQGQPFDFAFDIDSTGQAVLLPTAALKLGKQSGLQISALPFDSIKIAPTTGYNLDSAQVVHVNSVLRSEEHTSELQSHVNLVCRLL